MKACVKCGKIYPSYYVNGNSICFDCVEQPPRKVLFYTMASMGGGDGHMETMDGRANHRH